MTTSSAQAATAPVVHDTFLAWPNGGGETPCSTAYADASDAYDEAQCLASGAEEVEDWALYHLHSVAAETLRIELQNLRDQGHVGKPETYEAVIPAMAMLGGAAMTADGRVFNGEHYVGQM